MDTNAMQGDIGTDMSVYLVFWKAKNEADALINLEKSYDLFGEQGADRKRRESSEGI
jgi:hypothetical protein